MPSVSVLYLADSIVGPHLELLRNICEPQSGSRPHVTVRFFEKLNIPPEHLSTHIDHIDVIAPGSFGVENEWSQTNRTVYLFCESDELLGLEHKPHFPASFFHITLYDGRSLGFARALLGVLSNFSWGFRVPLPTETTLAKIEIKPRRSRTKKSRPPYREEVRSLFEEITSLKMKRALVDHLSDDERLEFAAKICSHLHMAISGFESVDSVRSAALRSLGKRPSEEGGEVHITPPELARAVAQYAVELFHNTGLEIHFGDPAVGNGAFFSALLKVLPREEIISAIGIDISAQQIEVARSRWSHRGLDAKLGDYLHMGDLPPRTLILANPPYLRHQDIPEESKNLLRERASVEIGIRVSGRAGLYVYFLMLTHDWMAPEAVAAWLIPSEFMQTDYGTAVRYYLTHCVQLIRVHRFDHREPQFEKAKVLPSVVVFRKREPRIDEEVLMSVGGTLISPVHCESLFVGDLRLEEKWNIPSVDDRSRRVGEAKIGDLFTVRRGIATGANDFFILTKSEAERWGVPAIAVRPILPKVRQLSSDIVERLEDGFPDLSPQLCLIDCDLPEGEISRLYPRFGDYLARAQHLGILDRNLLRQRRLWYRQERREPARFLCTYMGRGRGGMPPIRFIWNKSDAIVTNTYIMLYPRPALARLLKDDPSLEKELFDVLQDTARVTMRDHWRIHAGGLVKIEPGALLQVPLPRVPSWAMEVVELRL